MLQGHRRSSGLDGLEKPDEARPTEKGLYEQDCLGNTGAFSMENQENYLTLSMSLTPNTPRVVVISVLRSKEEIHGELLSSL